LSSSGPAQNHGRGGACSCATAAESLRDLRIAEVIEQDLQIEEGKVLAYGVKLKVSFKYEIEME
jgi:flavin-binding protein dodecin